ncbi:Uncharacterized protein T310_1650 [Rasamsonia emersonii CBS 393.64]|uniref:Uncharacterized protein n=1 Tax=Rasamsonia emersonii (strain ATCC 16479 / CBS 393.64 / IMI 116815) TaxID=1408163 RepID=A0A0F4Z376_RASE3|nr:Uncharacterized protein T310_1650 [Rasamsonia emersonii CBS 393.64]KKA24323.1 Uncharacterized protein T310_1650 [Rasamsonia emersonii CBS 393.64]
MQSPSSVVAFGPNVCSERRPMCRGVMDVANKRESSRSMSYSSAITSRSKPAVGISPSPSTPRRRASQGSLRPAWSPVSRFVSKETSPLQLPSFESLGISTSIPQKAHPRSLSADHSPQRSPLRPGRASLSGPPPVFETVQDSSRGDYATSLPLTPPADDDEHVSWNPQSDAPIFDAHINNREPKPQGHMDESRNRQSSSPSETRDDVYSPTDRKPSGRPPDEDERMAGEQSGSWLANSIDATISSLLVSNPRGEAVRIVSQTLPYPRAADRYVKLPTQNAVFGSIVQTIQDRLQPGQSPYINVTHAVPEQFSLSNLPTSPPSTPSHLAHRDDYFNSTVFCSATPVPAYHDFRGTIPSVPFPFPVVPPYSIHISVVERYLPPSSTQEYRDFFSHNRPSILMDRLIELSPNGGSLLLIYPTKRGAMTFKTQYLGPILDPLLRQLVVVNGLSADVGRSLGKLAAVNGMDDFDTMRANLVQLCEKISSPSSRFTVVEAGRGAAFLDRNLWTEWYIQQERSRMKDVLSVYWQNGRSLPGNSPVSSNSLVVADKEVTSAMLLGEILDGIKKRPYGDDVGPREGVELGVFVIRRSH